MTKAIFDVFLQRLFNVFGLSTMKSIIIFMITVFSMQLYAQPTLVNLEMAKQIAANFLSDNNQTKDGFEKNTIILFADDINMPNAYLFRINPQGFVIVSSTNELSPILAYSFENNFAEINTYEANITLEIIKEIVVNDLHQSILPQTRENNKIFEYGPYVNTMWGQVNCYNSANQLINVSNIYTPNHYAAGCVAISQISIMHHYNWPPRGVGAHAYTDNTGSCRGYYAANYSDSEYNWQIMLDKYRANESTYQQRESVGDIAFDVAISLYMNFEASGSTSNVNRIPTSLANYFRFTSLYRDKNTSGFWSLLDSNIVRKKPAILAVSGSLGGHSVVCDGLKIEDGNQYFYHLNMGWWGVSNGWYKIRSSFNAGGYTAIDGAVMNITPEPYLLTPEIFSDSSNTKLHWMYPENAEAEAFELQVAIDGEDWQTISNNITDTCYAIAPNIDKSYRYRIRAKTNGTWYSNSWSNTAYLRIHYASIYEDIEPLVKVYPSPFNNQLKLSFNKHINGGIINIYNISGEIIYSNIVNENIPYLIINSEKWNKGNYIVRVANNDISLIVKIIKK